MSSDSQANVKAAARGKKVYSTVHTMAKVLVGLRPGEETPLNSPGGPPKTPQIWESAQTKYESGAKKWSSVAGELKLRGTAFEFLVKDRKVWWCVSWLILWTTLSNTGIVSPIEEMPDAIAKQVTYYVSIVSFVLGFFSLQTYRSFQDQGRCATSLGGKVYELLFMVKVGLKDAPKVQHKVVRLVCAFTMVFWMDMSGVYSYSHLLRMGLLMPKELDALATTTAKKAPLTLLWAIDALQVHFQSKRGMANAGPMDEFMGHNLFLQLQNKIFEIRAKFSELSTMRQVDVPIVYSHCLWWLIMIFLTIAGYYAGIINNNDDSNQLWVLGYLAVMIAYLGLFDIALALKEPFGVDSVDLDPFYFINTCLKNCRTFMTSEIPQPDWEREQSATGPIVNFFTSELPIDLVQTDVKSQFMFADDDLAVLMHIKLQQFEPPVPEIKS